MAKTKRVWQPKKVKRAKKHGFLAKMATPGGRNVLKSRRLKGRKRLTVTYSTKQRRTND